MKALRMCFAQKLNQRRVIGIRRRRSRERAVQKQRVHAELTKVGQPLSDALYVPAVPPLAQRLQASLIQRRRPIGLYAYRPIR